MNRLPELLWVDISDSTDEVLKRICSLSLAPSFKYEACFDVPCSLFDRACMHAHAYFICMGTSNWINKVQTVVYCHVNIAEMVDSIICSPDTMMLPGSIYSWIIDRSVSAFLRSTGTKNLCISIDASKHPLIHY